MKSDKITYAVLQRKLKEYMNLESGKEAPIIRFEGFSDAWEQRKARDIFKPRIEKGRPELPVLSVTQYNGVVYRDSVGIDIKYDKNTLLNYKVIHPNDFVISLRSFQGGFELSDKLGITSPAYTIFIPQEFESYDVLFWKSQFKTYKFIESLKTVTFGIRDGKSISFSEFGTLKLKFPNQSHEQKSIGLLFERLNYAITLHQRKLDKLKQLKQGYLQQLFPQNDEKVPRVRFANFQEEWEQCKLGEIGNTHSGIGFPDSEQGGGEGTPFFKVSDMNNTGNEHEMKMANNYVSEEQLKRNKWKPNESVPAVIFAKVGAAIMLNRKRIIRIPFLNDNNTMTYVFDKSWNTDFGKTLFETINLPRFAQIGALPSYNGSDIESIIVSLPSKDEQTQIGSFFKNLDNTITLHQSKLDKLKLLKQALLQKMFI